MLFRYINPLHIYPNNQQKVYNKDKSYWHVHKNNIDMIYTHIIIDYIYNCILKLFKDE